MINGDISLIFILKSAELYSFMMFIYLVVMNILNLPLSLKLVVVIMCSRIESGYFPGSGGIVVIGLRVQHSADYDYYYKV